MFPGKQKPNMLLAEMGGKAAGPGQPFLSGSEFPASSWHMLGLGQGLAGCWGGSGRVLGGWQGAGGAGSVLGEQHTVLQPLASMGGRSGGQQGVHRPARLSLQFWSGLEGLCTPQCQHGGFNACVSAGTPPTEVGVRSLSPSPEPSPPRGLEPILPDPTRTQCYHLVPLR